jgi:hypothetical protein
MNKPIKSGGNAAKIIFVWGVMNKLDAVSLIFHSAILVGSIYGRSSDKIAHFIPIR